MAVSEGPRTQHEIVCFQTVRTAPPHAADFRVAQVGFDCSDDLVGYFVLQCEDIVELSIITLRPDVRTVFRIYQLRNDTHPRSCFADTAFENVTHPKFAADLLYVGRTTFVD